MGKPVIYVQQTPQRKTLVCRDCHLSLSFTINGPYLTPGSILPGSFVSQEITNELRIYPATVGDFKLS